METIKFVLGLIYLIYFQIFITKASDTQNLGLCKNSQCTEPIGYGVTLLKYRSTDDAKLSFEPGEEVTIFMKGYGPKKNILGVEHTSGRGYISETLVKETKNLMKNSNLVPAEVEFRSRTNLNAQAHSSISSEEQHVNPQPIVNSKHNMETSDWESPHTEGSHSTPTMDQSQAKNMMTDTPNSNLDSSMKFTNKPALELENQINLKPSKTLHSNSAPDIHHMTLDPSLTEQLKSSHGDQYSNHIGNNVNNSIESNSPSEQLGNKVKSINSQSNFKSKSQSFDDEPNSINYQDKDANTEASETMALLKGRGIETDLAEEDNESISSSTTAEMPLSRPNTDQINYKNFAYINSMKSRHLVLNDISSSTTDSSTLQEESTVVMKEKDTHSSFDIEREENEIDDGDEYSDIKDEDEEDYSSEIQSTESFPIVSNIAKTDSYASDIDNEEYSTKVSLFAPSKESLSHTTAPCLGLKSSHVASDENFETKLKTTDHITNVPSLNDPTNPQIIDSQSTNAKLEQDVTKTVFDENTHRNSLPQQDVIKTFSDENTHRNSLPQSSKSSEKIESSKVIPSVNNNFQTSINNSNDLKQDVDKSKNDNETNLADDFESKPSEIVATTTNPPKESQSSAVNQDENMEEEQIQLSVSENHVRTDNVDYNSNAYMGLNNTQTLDSLDDSKNDALNDDIVDGHSDINQIIDDVHRLDFDDDFKNDTLNNVVEDDSDINNIIDDLDKFDYEDDSVTSTVFNSYQIRDLKGESSSTESSNSEYENKVESSLFDFSFHEYIQSMLEVLRGFTETVMMVIPEPLYSYIMDFEKKGIPPRAIVFTALSAVPCLFLIIGTVYIKESSKEKRLSDQLLVAEKHLHSLSVEKQMLEEKIQVLNTQLSDIQTNFEKEKHVIEELNSKLYFSTEQVQDSGNELKTSLETIDFLQKKEDEYLSTLSALQKEKNALFEQTENLEKRLKEEEDSVTSLATQVQELEEDIKKLEDDKEGFIQAEVTYEGKISQLQLNCKQLLQEAEVWNIRVTELSDDLNKEKSLKDDLEKMVTTKDTEIESLRHIVQTMESFENSGGSEERGSISIEEKLKSFMDVSNTKIQLQREQEEKEALLEKLMLEKNKVLDFEVEMLEAKSEISKLKNSYNQALQDKTEAQTKLDVLSNYFKDKEIQLQKQLGAQEAVRQRTEDDANSAERRICLIEEENVSYKYQVASMKQEMEETERNLKNQIAVQEKKAHENWLSARAAERKLEEVKQEAAQLRQRLTLFERESEAYANSAHDDVVRPVPKRLPGPSDKAMNTLDGNNSMDMRYSGFEPHLPPPPLMLPPDRPRPPLLPPPMMPGFLPPHLDPGMPPPFRPWHDSFHESEFHTSPPDYMRRREMTPPRSHQSLTHDHEFGPHTSSPLSVDVKDSRNSTPPHALPNFHDIPPRPLIPPFPPMAMQMHSRLPLHPPPLRRELHAPRPADIRSPPPSQQNQSSSSERWHHSNSQV